MNVIPAEFSTGLNAFLARAGIGLCPKSIGFSEGPAQLPFVTYAVDRQDTYHPGTLISTERLGGSPMPLLSTELGRNFFPTTVQCYRRLQKIADANTPVFDPSDSLFGYSTEPEKSAFYSFLRGLNYLKLKEPGMLEKSAIEFFNASTEHAKGNLLLSAAMCAELGHAAEFESISAEGTPLLGVGNRIEPAKAWRNAINEGSVRLEHPFPIFMGLAHAIRDNDRETAQKIFDISIKYYSSRSLKELALADTLRYAWVTLLGGRTDEWNAAHVTRDDWYRASIIMGNVAEKWYELGINERHMMRLTSLANDALAIWKKWD